LGVDSIITVLSRGFKDGYLGYLTIFTNQLVTKYINSQIITPRTLEEFLKDRISEKQHKKYLKTLCEQVPLAEAWVAGLRTSRISSSTHLIQTNSDRS
jgi:hypothetical protein